MEAVSASKMRRSQERALASRAYADRAWEILTYLASQPAASKVLHPLLEKRAVRNTGLLLITPDRGLCGGASHVCNTPIGELSRSATQPGATDHCRPQGLGFYGPLRGGTSTQISQACQTNRL